MFLQFWFDFDVKFGFDFDMKFGLYVLVLNLMFEFLKLG